MFAALQPMGPCESHRLSHGAQSARHVQSIFSSLILSSFINIACVKVGSIAAGGSTLVLARLAEGCVRAWWQDLDATAIGIFSNCAAGHV